MHRNENIVTVQKVAGYRIIDTKNKSTVFFPKKDIDYICIDYDSNCIRIKLKNWNMERGYYRCDVEEVGTDENYE